MQHTHGGKMHTTLQNRYNIGSSSEHLPVVQHSNGSAMHELLHSAAHLELVPVGFPPGAPGAPCQAAHRHLCHFRNNLPLLPALPDVLLPAPKGLQPAPGSACGAGLLSPWPCTTGEPVVSVHVGLQGLQCRACFPEGDTYLPASV